jgi:hypothetical protein
MVKTILEVHENNLDYYKIETARIKHFKFIEIFFITFILLTLSVFFLILYCYEPEDWKALKNFTLIKNNMSHWKKNIIAKSNIESTRGKRLYLQNPNQDSQIFKCYDFGLYYAASRLNGITFLPEFIRRGNGDVWKVSKSVNTKNKYDKSAHQFCQYLTFKNSDNIITCGLDMYNKLGYGGYFNFGHPCQTVLDQLFKN